MTENKAELEGKFERWFYTARDPVKDMPYGTHLLYRVCDNDKDKFEIGCELLMAAFVGGHAAALGRIEAEEAVTDTEASSHMVQALRDYKLHQGQFGDAAARIIIKHLRAIGLRITKKK